MVRSFSTRESIPSEDGDTKDEESSSGVSSSLKMKSISSSSKSRPCSGASSIRRAHDNFSLTYGQERIGSLRDTFTIEGYVKKKLYCYF